MKSLNKCHNYFKIKILSILLFATFLICGPEFKAYSVDQPKFIVVEVLLTGKEQPLKKDAKFMNGIDVRTWELQQWRNHLIVYAYTPYPDGLKNMLAREYPHDIIKVYDKPFYKFDRKHCNNSASAKEWDNIILTANLVADQKKQQEYLNYHKTQFEKWPEVSQGFCNASFQQLLVFKNGRQLMLIISIPKGESLDKLNPLTTKNNPRVDEWNKIMAKYQEGIPGTKPGETWVFFKPIK